MSETDAATPAADRFAEVIATALREPPVRVRPLPLPDGDQLWLKRVEDLTHRAWQRKGDMRRLLRREREGYARMAEAGLPVVAMVDGHTDWLVTRDAGANLRHLLRSSDVRMRERTEAFAAAGEALAKLHRAGFTHGRPTMRAICWDGASIRFISLARHSDRRRRNRHFALDVMIFIHSCLCADRSAHDVLGLALGAYLDNAPEGTWPAVHRMATLMAMVAPAMAALRLARPTSRELNALSLALSYVTEHQRRP
ncbi:serine/threonine protein phosphatase [Cereibacter sphaeroides]|uniref:serine/threonine protein phosphatase n=1 Tax=Cereibacter sphaeroides TaxID=1063 RepID=UPI001F336A93|nr:serine/threonine protein phosphatase [Cereibacter sphaeroides]MCE6959419.1 serine/threonine protein phosphatase [Cereibacter sphaeroides]MCE6968308.1 serine/threonine protein phosphatase [Cereibacter sphaeroides]MCE6973810.1 serine/threonine protein phosphatase [Cereibacter sphaeroides]